MSSPHVGRDVLGDERTQREERSGGELVFRPSAPPLCPAAFKTKPGITMINGWERFIPELGASQLFAEPGPEQMFASLHVA